jgi:hypothetical protein
MAGPGVSGQQRLDAPAQGSVAAAGTLQVSGPPGRIGLFEGFGEDRHQAGVRVRHGIPSGTGFIL